MKEFLPVNNSEKTKWPTYFVERISAGQHFWKTIWLSDLHIFHLNYTKKYTETTLIFFQRSQIKKSTWKRRRYFAHRNYIRESTSKRRRFFAHRNYIHWKSASKWRGNLFIRIKSVTYIHNIDIKSTSIERGVSGA